jgi:hypothetical protein
VKFPAIIKPAVEYLASAHILIRQSVKPLGYALTARNQTMIHLGPICWQATRASPGVHLPD